MAQALYHIPVKLTIGLISQDAARIKRIKEILEKKFGRCDGETEMLDFSCTKYYNQEFGENLKRKFLSFERLIGLSRNYRIKLYTNKLEKKFSENKNRTVNIDPGYVSLAKLVLFTTKNRSHRIYIDRGIYAEGELQFIGKSFHPFEWTYPDYRTRSYISFFNSVRQTYFKQAKIYL